MEEAILIRKSQQGDMDAFEQLILLYEKKCTLLPINIWEIMKMLVISRRKR